MLSFFSLFFFITIDSFMLNLLRVDLVTIVEPEVIRSYQDILDRDGLQVLFHLDLRKNLFSAMQNLDP